MALDCYGGNHLFVVEHPLPGMVCLCGGFVAPSAADSLADEKKSSPMPDLLDLTALEMTIGGSYEMPDGRGFWLDRPVVLEIIRRAKPVILAALQRVQAETREADAQNLDKLVARLKDGGDVIDRAFARLIEFKVAALRAQGGT